MKPFGLYVHVPFCSALCPYCDFAVVVGKRDLHERYCAALVEEARAQRFDGEIASVFVGGGTPSFIDPGLLANTLRALGPWRDGIEVSIEANPDSIDARALCILRDAGVNRVSIGVQSFDDDVVRALGRTHIAADARAAVASAREAGIGNLSVDLIYGGPGETDESWERSLREAIALGVEHISCYALTIEERTPFGGAVARGVMRAPDDDALADRYERALEVLEQNGYEHYEISNWSKPGFACTHNMNYWTQGDYLGLGIGAHSHRGGHRWWNTRALQRYIEDPARARAGEELLDADARAQESLLLRTRLIRFDLPSDGRDFSDAVETLVRRELAVRAGEALMLTPKGMLLDNEVTTLLLSR